MVTPSVLLQDYNSWRDYTNHIYTLRKNGKYIRSLKMTPLREKALSKLIQFCGERGIDARLWLYSLFKKRRWLFAPKIDQLIPNGHLGYYMGLGDSPEFETKIRNETHEARVSSGREYDPNRDISQSTEDRKRLYLSIGDPDRCMRETPTETFGYHPKSLVCLRCPIKDQCKGNLVRSVSFDIIALRQGKLNAEDCRRRAIYYATRS